MNVSLLKLVNSNVKEPGKLTLGISNVAAPGGAEIGPVQVFTEQAVSSPVLSASSLGPVTSCLAGLQLLSCPDRLYSTWPNSQIPWDGYSALSDDISL